MPIGGNARVTVQTMTKTDTRDVDATLAQIRALEITGADIVRVAVPDEDAVAALGRLVGLCRVPLVADVHFDYRLAIAAVKHGAHGLRLNPGNIGGAARVREVVAAAKDHGVPIRVGVNSGSIEKDILARFGSATPEALVESALGHVQILEAAGHEAITISVKASDVERTVGAYRLLADCTPYALHLGVTEAGTLLAGTVHSCAALALLLSDGIGGTIRISLTEPPATEVRVGLALLQSLGLRPPGARVVSCPTCGRTRIDVVELAHRVESKLEQFYATRPPGRRPRVAVMGCMVNGPGEAREADIAVAGGDGKGAIYRKGKIVCTVPEEALLSALFEEIEQWDAQDA